MEKPRPTDEEYRVAATDYYQDGSDDDIEIDENAPVSQNDGGAWVQAWVYVRDSECGEQYTEGETDDGKTL